MRRDITNFTEERSMTAEIIYGTDFQARRNREAAAWPDPYEMLAIWTANASLMGDAWFQAVTKEPDER